MFHYGMTREQVGDCSLPFIFAITEQLGKRLCEHLGVPYNNDDDKNEIEDGNSSENIDIEEYPLKNEINKEYYKKYKEDNGNKQPQKKYIASSKSDIINFFSGISDFENK